MDLREIANNFANNIFKTEDDVKIHFYSDIVVPIAEIVNPEFKKSFRSENNLSAGGRTDASFQNISFEYKKFKYFEDWKTNKNHINEALFGRNENDHGLYHYIINNSNIAPDDTEDMIVSKILRGIGIGFDGKYFIFARFIPSDTYLDIDNTKSKFRLPKKLKISFIYEIQPLELGLRRLTLIVKQQNKKILDKQNLMDIINPKNSFVRESIINIYNSIFYNLTDASGSNRVKTLYNEWDRVFGIIYGNDDEATDFTEVSSKIKEEYGLSFDVNSKMYLFAMQTFFNIFLKLLIYSFLSQLINPTFTIQTTLTKADIDSLFDGTEKNSIKLVKNFFEIHFLEWFTFTDETIEEHVVNQILELLNDFDISSFVLKPENIQDIFEEIYMGLIPKDMRHLMGEYFSPDWIVEHSLEMLNYEGDINKSLIDPTCGSGSFIVHALKKIIEKNNGILSYNDIKIIVKNIVGFDINPISVVAAKANYILVLFSALFRNTDFNDIDESIMIPIFIADSVLAPVVYSEQNKTSLQLKTSTGNFVIPKFNNYSTCEKFLNLLSTMIDDKNRFEVFYNLAIANGLIEKSQFNEIKQLYNSLYLLHRSGKDSFWPIILKNSFAPILIQNKFDFVVGNPPWIAWKAMSQSYREGTLDIWKSYGIFEKNAYDKKTTHDDFGMAVTYVAIDYYLKDQGKMVFLLPASFLKSTKGGQGFRKLSIIRNNQNVNFSINMVHDFSGVNLFTIPTLAVLFQKGKKMKYPMEEYYKYEQIGGRRKINNHEPWNDVKNKFTNKRLFAKPVDGNDLQSAWLTMNTFNSFTNKLIDESIPRVYQGRKGIEPAGAKGVYILKKPIKNSDGTLTIENDITRQRRLDVIEKGSHIDKVEETYIYPMLGGRNISRWKVKSYEFMIVPHDAKYKYGIPETTLSKNAPLTFLWLNFYHDGLLSTRIQNGKFFDREKNPFYRLDNVGDYTFKKYKVLWKEQSGSMSAVVVSTYYETLKDADKTIFAKDKCFVTDSKVLSLSLDNEYEAYYVCGIINAKDVRDIIDSYAIGTNRGVDVLKYIAIPKFDEKNSLHIKIANCSKIIHKKVLEAEEINENENELNNLIHELFI